MKAQSGVFDGIFFLLIVTVSVTMMFVFASNYGTAQNEVLDTYYNLNYISAIMKSVYYVNAGQLSEISTPQSKNSESPYYGMDCSLLRDFNNTLVGDLVKRDLINDYSLDDNFTDSLKTSGVAAPGKMALRCALFEFMKNSEGAGIKYFLEVQSPKGQQNIDYAYETQKDRTLRVNQANNKNSIITNSYTMTQPETQVRTCEDLKNYTSNLFVVSIPFRVYVTAEVQDNSQIDLNNTFKMNFCMWSATEILR